MASARWPTVTCPKTQRPETLSRSPASNYFARRDGGGLGSAALPWCPAWAGAGPTIPPPSAALRGALLGGDALHRLLLRRGLRLGLHCCLSHLSALSLSLSFESFRTNRTLNKFAGLVDSEGGFGAGIFLLSNRRVAASPQFLCFRKCLRREMQRAILLARANLCVKRYRARA